MHKIFINKRITQKKILNLSEHNIYDKNISKCYYNKYISLTFQKITVNGNLTEEVHSDRSIVDYIEGQIIEVKMS